MSEVGAHRCGGTRASDVGNSKSVLDVDLSRVESSHQVVITFYDIKFRVTALMCILFQYQHGGIFMPLLACNAREKIEEYGL